MQGNKLFSSHLIYYAWASDTRRCIYISQLLRLNCLSGSKILWFNRHSRCQNDGKGLGGHWNRCIWTILNHKLLGWTSPITLGNRSMRGGYSGVTYFPLLTKLYSSEIVFWPWLSLIVLTNWIYVWCSSPEGNFVMKSIGRVTKNN